MGSKLLVLNFYRPNVQTSCSPPKGASCPGHQSRHVPLLSLQKSSWKVHISTFAEKERQKIQ